MRARRIRPLGEKCGSFGKALGEACSDHVRLSNPRSVVIEDAIVKCVVAGRRMRRLFPADSVVRCTTATALWRMGPNLVVEIKGGSLPDEPCD